MYNKESGVKITKINQKDQHKSLGSEGSIVVILYNKTE